MGNKITRSVALSLLAALLISLFSIFAFAEDTGEGTEDESTWPVYYNRTFDEGFSAGNGATLVPKSNEIIIDVENEGEDDENKYMNFIMAPTVIEDCYVDFNIQNKTYQDFVVEFSLKYENKMASGKILVYKDGANSFSEGNLLTVQKDPSGYYYMSVAGQKLCDLELDEWVHVALVMKLDEGKVSAYVKDEEGTYPADPSIADVIYNSNSGISGINTLRFHAVGTSEPNSGYSLDNLKFYAGTKIRDIPADNYGTLVNASEPVTDGDGVVALKNSAVFKIGTDYALVNLEKTPIFTDKDGNAYGTPVVIDGVTYLPVDTVAKGADYTLVLRSGGLGADLANDDHKVSLVIGKKSITKAGVRYPINYPPINYSYDDDPEKTVMMVAIDDISTIFDGFYVTYDDMGLIIVCGEPDVYNREDNLADMVNLMNMFIFEAPAGDKVIEDIEANIGLDTHPKLLVDQERFDELRGYYTDYLAHLSDPSVECDEDIGLWISKSVDAAKKYVTDRFVYDADTGIWSWKINDDGSSVAESLRNPYYLYDENGDPLVGQGGYNESGTYIYGDGYDVGGRSSATRVTGYLDDIGFAWQMSTDPAEKEMYKQAFYLITVEAGKWPHWGPGHFLNCADATAPYALGFDWIYNAFDPVEDAELIEDMVDVLFQKGVYMGYVQFHTELPEYKLYRSARQGSGFNWKDKTNNWVTVCASGMVIGALAMIEYVSVEDDTYDYNEILSSLIADTIADLPDSFAVYAPDGCYVESPGYWSYGTNTFFLMNEALDSAAGSTYGFMDCYGIDKTCNFATYIESSDYQYWNYHDAGNGSVDSSYFTWYGQYMDQLDIASIRYMQIRNGKTSANLQDILFYNPDLKDKDIELSLDYYCEGIQTFVSRSSWEKGAMFVGLHGGKNTVPHGNYDAGNFIIYLGKDQFVIDLGSDNYNLGSYYENGRYYRLSVEGANTIAIIEPDAAKSENWFGQATTADVPITSYYSDEHGAYAIADMSSAYSGYVDMAERGMLYTNDRRTVVIQDEIVLSKAYTLYWFMHTNKAVELSNDGKTAYISETKNGVRTTLRATIVSRMNLKFELTDAYDFLLETTYDRDEANSNNNLGQTEYSRDGISRLKIKAENVIMYECAVVFDVIESKEEAVGYSSVVSMHSWTTSDDAWLDEANANIGNEGPSAPITDIRNAEKAIESYGSDKFTTKLEDTYALLVKAYQAVLANDPSKYNDDIKASYNKYLGYKGEYETYISQTNDPIQQAGKIAANIMGVK